MLRIAIIAFIVAIAAFPAGGQTTQPTEKSIGAPSASIVDQAWPRTLEVLASALAKGDAAQAETVLAPRVMIHGLESMKTLETATLAQRLAGSTVVGQHGYLHPPMVMAADIAADFKNAASINDKAKAHFLIDDDSEMKRANTTAVQWVVEQLGPRAGTPIGVIVLWTPKAAPVGSTEKDAGYDATFILCRGEEVAAHEFKITSIVFGNPVPQSNP